MLPALVVVVLLMWLMLNFTLHFYKNQYKSADYFQFTYKKIPESVLSCSGISIYIVSVIILFPHSWMAFDGNL